MSPRAQLMGYKHGLWEARPRKMQELEGPEWLQAGNCLQREAGPLNGWFLKPLGPGPASRSGDMEA